MFVSSVRRGLRGVYDFYLEVFVGIKLCKNVKLSKMKRVEKNVRFYGLQCENGINNTVFKV